jgi:uncharacterized OB-fold protein
MIERDFPAPPVNAESAAFNAAAELGRFLLRRCAACGRAHWYPRALCPFCFGPTAWEAASGRGVIYSYSVMRRAAVPYAIAYVALAEGPVMLTNLVECDFDTLRIGQDVRVVFRPSQGGPLVPCFRPERGS